MTNLQNAKRIPVIWYIFLLALLIRWGVFYCFYFIYKTPGGVPPSPNANEIYELLARYLLGGQGFESWMFAYRPPLYSMFIAATYGLIGPHPLVVVFIQTIISASICLLTYSLVGELGGNQKVRLIAATFAALDPGSIAISIVLVAENVANPFIAASLMFFVRLIKTQHWRDVFACAGCVLLATLARPTAVYFVIVVAALVVIAHRRQWFAQALVISCFVIAGLLPWYVRNYAYQDVFTYATTSDFNLLFYKGVSVEVWSSGRSPLEIQAQLAYELDRRLGIIKPRETYDENTMWQYLVSADSRVYGEMRQMALEIFADHPITFLALIPASIIKTSVFSGLPSATDVVGWLALIYNIVLFGGVLLGLWLALKHKHWLWLAVTFIPASYFLLVPAVTGGVYDTRSRTNIIICLALLTALGWNWIWVKRYENRRVRDNAPRHLP